MSNYLYTVSKPFVFKGMSFKAGDSFDPEKVQCPAQRLRTLLSARLLVPGYEGAVEAPKAATKTASNAKAQKKAEESNNAPEAGDDNAPEQTEGEKAKSGANSKQSSRRGRRN